MRRKVTIVKTLFHVNLVESYKILTFSLSDFIIITILGLARILFIDERVIFFYEKQWISD